MKNTRLVTEGAILLAIYSVLILAYRYIPFLSLILAFIMPLPFILFSIKYTLKESFIICACALGLTVIITSVSLLPFTLMFSTVGILIGYLINKKRSKEEILLSSTFLYLIHTVLIYSLAKLFFHIDFVKAFTNSMNEAIKQSQSLGLDSNNAKLDQFKMVIKLIPSMLPTLLLMYSFVLAFLTQVLTFPLIKRLGFKIPKFKPFRDFKLPLGFVWVFFAVFILSFFKFQPGSFFALAILNISYILEIALIIQGFAVIFNFCYSRQLSKAIPIVILIMCLLIPNALFIVSLIGIIGMGFNSRIRK